MGGTQRQSSATGRQVIYHTPHVYTYPNPNLAAQVYTHAHTRVYMYAYSHIYAHVCLLEM